jgi:hypothetical protein
VRRFIDAMLVTRDIKLGTSAFAKRVGADGADLIRDTHYKLKVCIMNDGEAESPEEEAKIKAAGQGPKRREFLGPYLYDLKQ